MSSVMTIPFSIHPSIHPSIHNYFQSRVLEVEISARDISQTPDFSFPSCISQVWQEDPEVHPGQCQDIRDPHSSAQ